MTQTQCNAPRCTRHQPQLSLLRRAEQARTEGPYLVIWTAPGDRHGRVEVCLLQHRLTRAHVHMITVFPHNFLKQTSVELLVVVRQGQYAPEGYEAGDSVVLDADVIRFPEEQIEAAFAVALKLGNVA